MESGQKYTPTAGEPAQPDAVVPAEGEAAGRKRRGFLKFPRTWKEVRGLGWKFIVAFILFYLIRDLVLYVLVPYLIYKGVISL